LSKYILYDFMPGSDELGRFEDDVVEALNAIGYGGVTTQNVQTFTRGLVADILSGSETICIRTDQGEETFRNCQILTTDQADAL